MTKIKSMGKIIIAIVVSILVTKLVSSFFFIDNSQTLRPNPQEYIANYVKQSTSTLLAGIAERFGNKTNSPVTLDNPEVAKIIEERTQALQSVPFRQIAKGIKAQENGTTSITTIDTGEVESVQYTFKDNGKDIVVTIPKVYYDQLGLNEQKIKDEVLKME